MNVCPEEIRAANRRKKNKKVWESDEWNDAVAEWLPGKTCIWCGLPAQVAHHPTDENYGKRQYFDLSTCWAMCNECHKRCHRGLVLCPECKERYTKYERCYACLSQERKDEIERDKIRKRKLRRMLNKQARARFLEKIKTFGSIPDKEPFRREE